VRKLDFQPGLTIIDPASADEIVKVARGADTPVFVVSTSGHVGREAFFDAVRAALPLDPPLHSSRSWDALSDSLWEGIRLLESDKVVIIWPDASAFRDTNQREYEIALSILSDIAESIGDSVTTDGRPKQVSVYVGGATC
jgi:hypothetical protein